MSVHQEIDRRMRALANEVEARHLMRFFKTAPGEYGEGDIFLGLRVPMTRAIVKEFRNQVDMADIQPLVDSPYHEIRLAGLLLLVELYSRLKKSKDKDGQRRLVEYYLSIIERGNNWDLVDLVAYKILGDWLIANPADRSILDKLAEMDGNLWHQRVSIVSTMALICNGEFDDTFRIALKLKSHPHDLIHKAVGWMLREVGKRGGRSELLAFLDLHAPSMPRTMLRYAIEHLPPDLRRHYLTLT